MSCGHCTAAITKEIAALDPAAVVTTDLEKKTVTVVSDHTSTEVAMAIAAAGFEAGPA
jgi:copper chaperone